MKVNNDAHVCVIVYNTESACSVNFNVYKKILNATAAPEKETTVTMKAECVTALDGTGYANGDFSKGKTITALLGQEFYKTVTIKNDTGWKAAEFQIDYANSQFSGYKFPVKLTYKITEQPSATGEYTHDETVFYVTYYLVQDSSGKLAQYGGVNYSDADGNVISAVGYSNYLLGDLTFEKQVVGGQAAKEETFKFEISLMEAKDNKAIKNWPVRITINNGTPYDVKTDAVTGIIKIEGIKHGDVIKIEGIPVGAYWKISELCADNFITTWQQGSNTVSGYVADGTLDVNEEKVVFTNTSTYTLPETGGAGTIPYTMAGLVLILFSMAYLMYRSKARRRGAFESP